MLINAMNPGNSIMKPLERLRRQQKDFPYSSSSLRTGILENPAYEAHIYIYIKTKQINKQLVILYKHRLTVTLNSVEPLYYRVIHVIHSHTSIGSPTPGTSAAGPNQRGRDLEEVPLASGEQTGPWKIGYLQLVYLSQ